MDEHDDDKEGWLFKQIATEDLHLRNSDEHGDRPAIMHLINHESGWARNEIGTRVFDQIKKKTKEIAQKEPSKLPDLDREELDKTMFLYGYPTPPIVDILTRLTKSNNDRVGFVNKKNIDK